MLLLNKYLKTSVQLVVCLFLFKKSLSQNLIQNGSFENYTNPIDCGSGGFDNSSVFPINHVVNNWYTLNSCDYFNGFCSSSSAYSIPSNLFGNNIAKQGNAYVGFLGFGSSYETKEYLYQQLSSPLQASKIYCLSFFISRADKITHAIKNIGAYFSVSTPTLFSNYYVNAIPQVVNQNGFITDTTTWTETQGCFTASGGEQYITIGNFNSNSNTDTLYAGTNNLLSGAVDYAYYYIDDIWLIDQTTVGVNELGNENNFEIYPNPNNGSMQFNYELTKRADLIVTDITGRIVNSYTLDESQKSITIKELQINAGIYFYTVKQNSHILKQDKFVIIK